MATRCHILRLNVLHSIPAVALPQTRWGCLQRFPDSLDGFEGPYFKGKGVEGKKREGKGSFCLLHSLSVGIFATSEVFATRNFVVFIDTHIRFVWQSATQTRICHLESTSFAPAYFWQLSTAWLVQCIFHDLELGERGRHVARSLGAASVFWGDIFRVLLYCYRLLAMSTVSVTEYTNIVVT